MHLINVGIYGASGYTGYELFKLLRHHPNGRNQVHHIRKPGGQ